MLFAAGQIYFCVQIPAAAPACDGEVVAFTAELFQTLP